MKNRSRMDIVYDIISAARPSAKKTHLMYRSNLSFKQLDLYLETLLRNGLLEERIDDEGTRRYYITARGMSYLERFEYLGSFFNIPRQKITERYSDAPLQLEEQEIQTVREKAFVY